MRSRCAIVMLSIGDSRTWRDHAFSSFEAVADRWGVDTHLVTRDDASEIFTSDLERRPGRPHKRAYALKSYYAWKFLTEGEYGKVLMVDDTCVIHPHAANVFDLYKDSRLGIKKTSPYHARDSFRHIRDMHAAGHAELVKFKASLYGNTGVVLYDQSVAEAFSPQEINNARRMLYAKYPHQTLFYYLHQKARIPVDLMDDRWNHTPARELSAIDRRGLTSVDDYINLADRTVMHFTGAYANRKQLVESLAASYRNLALRHQ